MPYRRYFPAQHENPSARNVHKFSPKFGDRCPAFSIKTYAGDTTLAGEPVRLAHLCRGQDFHARFSSMSPKHHNPVMSSACSGDPDHSSAACIMASAITWEDASLLRVAIDQTHGTEFFAVYVFGLDQAVAVGHQHAACSISSALLKQHVIEQSHDHSAGFKRLILSPQI
jgi:hypothetical protein